MDDITAQLVEEFTKEFDGEFWVKAPGTDWANWNEGPSGDYENLVAFLEQAIKRAYEAGRRDYLQVDEIPQAYKDIDQVMEDAQDLVTVLHTLHQIVNVKGD